MSYSYESYSYSTQEFITNTNPPSSSNVSYVNDVYSVSEPLPLDNYASFSNSNSALAQSTSSNQIANDMMRLIESNSRANTLSFENFANKNNNNNNKTPYLVDDQTLTLSTLEASILRSAVPVDITETEEITVLGQRGIWANRSEELNWRGSVPISQYPINDDRNPEVVVKRISKQLEYVQELAIRYLRPPTPPMPGEIVIKQLSNQLTPPAPPLIIRQQPPRPPTPEPLVIRESPPKPPAAIGRKLITISGRHLPPPPRKVVIERLAPLPSKPQSVIIERWLPYNDKLKRRVIFQKAPIDPVIAKPRNIIVQWEAPEVHVKKDFKYLGIIRANPVDYVHRYGNLLKTSQELPQFVLDIKPPNGVVLASEYTYNAVHELEGDIEALKLVDLEREGLGEYRAQLQNRSQQHRSTYSFIETPFLSPSSQYEHGMAGSGYVVAPASDSSSSSSYSQQQQQQQQQFFTPTALSIIEQIYSTIDIDSNGNISVEEAEKILLRLNSRLNRNYGENEVAQFFHSLDSNRDGQINLNEFKAAFQRLL